MENDNLVQLDQSWPTPDLPKEFKKFAESCKPKEFSFPEKVKIYFEKYITSLSLATDIVTHIVLWCTGSQNDFLEGGMTIGLHLLTVMLSYLVMIYSSLKTKILENFVLLLLGCYDVEWHSKKTKSDENNGNYLKTYLDKADDNPDEVPNFNERTAVVNLCADQVVDSNLSYRATIGSTLPMAIFKIYIGFIAPYAQENCCSFATLSRLVVIVTGLRGPISKTVQHRKDFFKYLTAHSWKYYVDSGFYNEVLETTPLDKWSLTSLYIFIATFLAYRVATLLNIFAQGVESGIFYLVAIFGTNLAYNYWVVPICVNPPIGAPTTGFLITDAWSKIFVPENTLVKHPRCCIWPYFVLITLQHLISVVYRTTFYNYVLAPTAISNLTETCECNSKFFAWINTNIVDNLRLIEFPLHSDLSADFVFNDLANFLFLAVIAVTFLHLGLISYTGVPHCKFPTATAFNIWDKKFMARFLILGRFKPNANVWLQKMFTLTVLSASEFKAYLKNKPKTDAEWNPLFEATAKCLDTNKYRNTAQVKEFLEIENTPCKSILSKILDYVGENTRVSPGGEGITRFQMLAYRYCIEFENSLERMNAERIAAICNALGESPLVPADFTPDCEDSWLLIFK